ncbi:MAG: electron transfer flavoprotein subunit beta/FixA family protein [Verrucomicrobia bacterium]|nr:electron transfer flavoprotein subunit beta/FixA family protein [Verrucomicrobiota bacterium]
MKICTILKQVPDAEASIRTSGDRVDLSGVTFVMDGMDEYGVEEAIRLREGGAQVEIVALALGPKRFEDAIRTSLAIGADRAVHIETDETYDAISQARILAEAVKKEGAELVFVGGKEADWDSAALGPALAEVLGWPHVDWTTKLALSGAAVEATHDTDSGTETVKVALPAVITTQQGLNEPRYPTLPNIMKAKRKELRKAQPADYGAATALTRLTGEAIQVKTRLNKLFSGDAVESATALVNALRNEAKVL